MAAPRAKFLGQSRLLHHPALAAFLPGVQRRRGHSHPVLHHGVDRFPILPGGGPMSGVQIAFLSIAVMLVLIYSGMHVAIALILLSFGGVWLLRGNFDIASNM